MKRQIRSAGALLMLWLALALPMAGGQARAGAGAGAGKIEWVASYAAAIKKAKATNRPVMIDFYADWCGWCKKLDSDVYTEAGVVSEAKGFISVKLNTENDAEGRELARKHQVQGLPTVLFVSPAGKALHRITGFKPAPQFAEEMRTTRTIYRELPVLIADFKARPNDLASASQLAALYAKTGNEQDARTALARVEKLDPKNAKGEHIKAVRALAEMYVGKRDLKNAVAMFRQGVRIATSSEDAAYCRLSAGVGLLMLDDIRGAVAEFLEGLKDPRLPERDKEAIKKTLARIPTPLW